MSAPFENGFGGELSIKRLFVKEIKKSQLQNIKFHCLQ